MVERLGARRRRRNFVARTGQDQFGHRQDVRLVVYDQDSLAIGHKEYLGYGR